MKEKKIKKYMGQGIFFMSLSLLLLISYVLIQSKNIAGEILSNNYTYVSYEILTDNIIPVIREEETKEIMRPYKDETVTIGENYYDYKAEKEKQEQSIVYYEGTYIQNTGVNYVSKEIFKVFSVADGKVISITEDDITGKTIKIEHNNGLISVYQSVSEIIISENDTVSKGQQIAQSGKNNFNSNLGNHLHFELYKNNKHIDPEKYFEENIGKF